MALSCVCVLLLGRTALAQDATAAEPEAEALPPAESEIATVTVVGSRIKRRTIATAAPVSVIDGEDMLAVGRPSVAEILQRLPSSANAINLQFNNGGNGAARINLRSLGTACTLVLVNGRRFVPGGDGADASVDLNAIPTSIIDRIEVLKDGGSAVYGSDAIAGVVNIITKKDFTGVEANAYDSITQRGDGRIYQVDLTAGIVSDDARSSLLFSVQFSVLSAFSGSVLASGESCPGPELQPDVPGATDCPAETFCDAPAAGRCLAYQLSLVGVLGGRDIDLRVTGAEATTVACIREYLPADPAEEGAEPPAPSGVSEGLKLVITGTLAQAISPGAAAVTVDVSNGDVLGGLPFLVLPETNAPASRGDSVIASLAIDATELAAIGGQVTLDSVSGPDENGDNLIDDNRGAIGGTFFLGFPDGQFLAGAFVAPCGPNEILPLLDAPAGG